MEDKILAKAVVKGTEGIARFALEHIKDLAGGRTVDFAAWCPDEVMGSLEDFKKDSQSWFGIAGTNALAAMDNERLCLVMDHYGGSWSPQIFVFDDEDSVDAEAMNLSDLTLKIESMIENEADGIGDEELVYVECVEH